MQDDTVVETASFTTLWALLLLFLIMLMLLQSLVLMHFGQVLVVVSSRPPYAVETLIFYRFSYNYELALQTKMLADDSVLRIDTRFLTY